MEEAEEVGWVDRAKQASNRHTQKLPCSIWAVPTCGGGGGRDVRVRDPSLSGARFKWTDWRTGKEKPETDASRGRRCRHTCGNGGEREGIRKLCEQGQASTRINHESLSTSTISTLLDPQEFPTSLSPLAYCYSFALPKTYNNTTESLSLYTTSLLHSFSPTACVSALGPS